MGKIKGALGITIIVVLLVSVGALVVLPVACTSNQNTIKSPSFKSPDKGNPKLDSQLNQLLSAETRGEAASFAEKNNIVLTDGRVRVIIECMPGQIEVATQAAKSTGAIIETSYDNLLQVVVPVASLSTLADIESIRFIRLPQQPLPAPNK